MTFPASNAVTESWFNSLMNDVLNLKSYCTQITAATNGGGTVSATIVLNLASWCIQFRNDIAAVVANATLQTALVAYFQQQLGATSLSITTEFGAMNTIAGNILTGLSTDYPHDGTGKLLDRTFSVTTGISWVTLSAAQLSNTMTPIAAMIAAVV